MTYYEQRTFTVLQRRGLNPVRESYHCPWDMTCGEARVELKGSKFSKGGWAFNIHRHNELDESQVDFYVLHFTDVPEMISRNDIFLVMRAPLGVYTLSITPRLLLLKFGKHNNRFDLIRNFKGARESRASILAERRMHAAELIAS
jgi:hypothetical protein